MCSRTTMYLLKARRSVLYSASFFINCSKPCKATQPKNSGVDNHVVKVLIVALFGFRVCGRDGLKGCRSTHSATPDACLDGYAASSAGLLEWRPGRLHAPYVTARLAEDELRCGGHCIFHAIRITLCRILRNFKPFFKKRMSLCLIAL